MIASKDKIKNGVITQKNKQLDIPIIITSTVLNNSTFFLLSLLLSFVLNILYKFLLLVLLYSLAIFINSLIQVGCKVGDIVG